jgi:hypothetical protein
MSTTFRNMLSVVTLLGLSTAIAVAQSPAPAAPSPAAPSLTLTATSANVNGAGEKVEFYINRWSPDADRDKLSAAWKVSPAPAPAAAAGDGAAPAAGRGGRGGGRGAGAPAAPRTPEAALATALKDLTPVGYFWTSEVGGYVIRYAVRTPGAGGGSRIILLTDKRLGAARNNWQPVPPGGAANTYEFALIELRLPAKGDGDGKASLIGTIGVDPETKGLALEGYDALPVTLRGVKVRSES